ncbi:MAG: hypothetical protein ABI759_01045 [Candidatus Solibacter sp.]
MNDGFVTVGTYATAFEANVVRNELLAFGVNAVLEDQYVVGLNVLLTNMLDGVKVRVPQGDLEEALRILLSEPGLEDVVDEDPLIQ